MTTHIAETITPASLGVNYGLPTDLLIIDCTCGAVVTCPEGGNEVQSVVDAMQQHRAGAA